VRSLTNRLALLFAAITAAVLLVIYLYVISPLQSNLRDQQLRNLAAAAIRYSTPIEDALEKHKDGHTIDSRVRAASQSANARVTVLEVNRGANGLSLVTRSDSAGRTGAGDLQFLLAAESARSRHRSSGTEAGTEGPVGEATEPIYTQDAKSGQRTVGAVLVFSAPQRDVQSNVRLVRNRLVVAGLIALVIALVAGYALARALIGRVQRIESAARRVASGDFTAQFPTGDNDELGDLARVLDEMQTQLAELESARKQFIATASHELRTPIFSLGGYVELLQDEDLDETTRQRFLAQIRDQVDRLGRLTTDLLDLSRLEAGSLELRREDVDVRDVVQMVAADFSPALDRRESNLEVRVPAEPVRLVCDPERVAQVLRILIDNALAHTPAGTDVVVSAAPRPARVRLAVTDYGTGIKRGALPHIFEPFYTADDEQQAQGSGLGLAIAHELTERMGGILDVDSRPGRTTFTLDIPT
jgi:signal transduction histidine kinase